ncbi:P-loop containing nucleoside triphosphate hydrolase protein [Lasiosphaeria miniovina]|uniref:P-loop containing nucleoside triphosphate hydrolase protein n=1 Tax=Lasiosphaeria miniovina TaxID=1954250 RepID=A0AA40E7T2_9PEZI|nr:P-loop containing nucleoside triphosphate hydrolase protein [Lasiosphaeria miniovina]KAK0727161.1 P-loop containing nucleoside triphosphate hydrolase protein [Lasiosphaeria miniovina]
MLWRATQQFNRFRDIIELVSGIVFLATPHFKDSSDDSGKLLSLVLRSDLMANPKKAFSKSDLSALAYTSWQFEELKLKIPILSYFRGRSEELQLIHEALPPEQPSGGQNNRTKQPKAFVIHGLGGIGKTQLAVEYIFSKRDSYDAIFWLQADQTDTLSAGFARIAIELGLESKESADDQVASREIVKAWLADPLKSSAPSPSGDNKHARWLIVFDNADKPEELLDGGFWPRDGQGSVLVTSRDPMSKSDMFFGNVGIELDALGQSEAAILLRKLSRQEGRESSEQLSMDVVQKLNCYPLAIVQMAGIIRRRNLSLAEFLEIYCQEEERTELHELRVGTLHGYGLTLSSVWAFNGFNPGARQILSVVALLDPDSIVEEILTTAPQDSSLESFPQTKPAFLRDLSTLTQSSIIHRNTDQNELSIHRMVQDVIRSQLLKTDDLVDRWTQCERVIPHVVRLRQIFNDFDKSKQQRTATVDFVWLLAEGAWYHLERSNPRECLDFIKTGFKLTEVSLEDLSFIRAELHGTRSSIGLEMNETETALYHQEENVAFREATLAKDGKLNNKLAAGYSEYRRALMACGIFTKAAEMFEKSISIREQLPGFKRLQLFNPLRGLALVRWHEGAYEEASELLLSALRDRELAFGRDDKESSRTGELLYSLGSVHQSQGRLEESFVYHQRALLQLRSSIGDNHHLTAKACYNLSMHYLRFGDYEHTVVLLDQASRVFSRGHYYAPELARVTFMLGHVLVLQGNTRAGDEPLARAWNMRQRLVPGDLRPVDEL